MAASPSLSPTRTATVDGRAIVVIDGTVPAGELAVLTSALEQGRFRRTEYARPDTIEHRHWVLEPVHPEMGAPTLVDVTKQAVAQFYGAGYDLFRVYCNVAVYGDALMTHTDCGPRDDIVTALWYVTTEWDVEWGGETLFFDENADAVFCISPKPGRLALFHGAIPHAGRPPNRNCYRSRFTLALKFVRPPTPSA